MKDENFPPRGFERVSSAVLRHLMNNPSTTALQN